MLNYATSVIGTHVDTSETASQAIHVRVPSFVSYKIESSFSLADKKLLCQSFN